MRRKKPTKTIISILILIAISTYVYIADAFERELPKIDIANEIYWNFNDKIELTISDNIALKEYSVDLISGDDTVRLKENVFTDRTNKQIVQIAPPTINMFESKSDVQLKIELKDRSLWNFFQGNKTVKIVNVKIDMVQPVIYPLYHTSTIKQGSAATIVFRVDDPNLQTLKIETGGAEFVPSKFYKENYYISLVAWPVTQRNFKVVVVATDKANNISKKVIKINQERVTFKDSYIQLKDKFVNGKISDLIDEFYPKNSNSEGIEKFKLINETQRNSNENYIHNITSYVDEMVPTTLYFEKFKPLKNSAVVASFGDHRFFYQVSKINVVSESYHLGIDLASTKMADIISSNSGIAISDIANGIYGNMPAIYHGFGLYTIYGHCSNVMLTKGEKIEKGAKIAQTGMSGLALGDHLHFGVLVQGVEVNPYDWMRQDWIDRNIVDVIKQSKLLIDMR